MLLPSQIAILPLTRDVIHYLSDSVLFLWWCLSHGGYTSRKGCEKVHWKHVKAIHRKTWHLRPEGKSLLLSPNPRPKEIAI
ncbi:hypothetical protein MANES_02G038501v8 [Manihot esculenta]|uniref:Uncharacterized protein n=1 Tax=Manihot esculenta TaxID=3983 RepID=A0A2C9WB00_MANES|nr:hypothetical protein MANES_02G038501v8 [Manihot esculenta]